MRVGVVGCGYWGPNLIRNLVEGNRCAEVVCCDRDPDALTKIMRKFPSVTVTTSIDKIWDSCDAVMIATPVTTHYPLVKKAIQCRKPVFVEKPLATSSFHGEELVALANEHNVPLMVGHTFVYSPPVRKVKEYISSGILGQLYFLSSSRVNLGIHQQDTDVLWDLAPHDVSILLYWLEEMPHRVSAVGRACIGKMVDVASVHLEFPSGVLANVEMSWLAPSKLRRTFVVGNKSMVIYDDTEPNEKIRLCDRGVMMKAPESFGEFQLSYRTGDIISPKLDTTEPLFCEVNHFLDCAEHGKRPLTDGIAGLNVVRVIEAASRSMYSDGAFVDVQASVDKPTEARSTTKVRAANAGVN